MCDRTRHLNFYRNWVRAPGTKSDIDHGITMFPSPNTPTPTNSRRKSGKAPMTRKRRRELEAEDEAVNDSPGPDSQTSIHEGKRAKRSSKATPKQSPARKGKARALRIDVDSAEEGKRTSSSKPAMQRPVRGARKANNPLLTPP